MLPGGGIAIPPSLRHATGAFIHAYGEEGAFGACPERLIELSINQALQQRAAHLSAQRPHQESFASHSPTPPASGHVGLAISRGPLHEIEVLSGFKTHCNAAAIVVAAAAAAAVTVTSSSSRKSLQYAKMCNVACSAPSYSRPEHLVTSDKEALLH